ncbi:retrotransposon protein, putative, ty1-copia subclass [Tanacetum coccineum]
MKVENQLGKTIKALRSDREGGYISQEFTDYLKACRIIQQLTPPYTLQHNGDYANETATRIFNMVPTKKALVKRDTLDKLQQRSVRIPEGNYSVKAKELKEIQDKDTLPSENTSEIPIEVEGFEPPQVEVVPIHRFAKTHRAPDRLCLNVEGEEHRFREATFILGIKIYRDRLKRLIGLIQSAYMDKILKRFRINTSKHGYIPMQERLDLNKIKGASTPEEVKREPLWSAVKTILKYLKNTEDMFLVYDGNPEAELQVDCYCYARFDTNRDDIKFQTGYVFVLNGGVMDWKSSKQSTTAMSATYVEYIAASEAAMKVVWIKKCISGLGIVPTINEPIKMFCDNSAALLIANESGAQRGARHYHRRYHYVRECIELGEINILKVHTDDNLADP